MNKKLLLFFTLTLLSFSLVSATLISDMNANSYAYYKMENNAYDVVNGYNGTVNSGTYIASAKIDGGYSFDNDNYDISLPESNYDFERTDSFSMFAWIYIDADTGNYRYVFSKSEKSAGKYRGIFFDILPDEKLSVEIRNTLGTNEIAKSTTSALSVGSWIHVGFSYDGSSDVDGLTIYVNGASVSTSSDSDSLSNTILNDVTPHIGGTDLLTSNFDGDIDEFVVFDFEANVSVASYLYDSGSPDDDQQYEFGTPIPSSSTSYFKVDLSNVNTFNSTIDSVFYSTTNGTIQTTINSSLGSLETFTLNSEGYFSKTITNFNTSNNVSTSLNEYPEIQSRNFVNNSLIKGFGLIVDGVNYYDVDDDGSIFLPFSTLKNLTFTDSDYLSNTQELNLVVNQTYNFSAYQTLISFKTFEKYALNTIYNFTVSGGGLSNTTINGNSTLKLNADNNITVTFTNSLGYYNQTFDISVSPLDILTYNITAYNHKLNFTPRDYFSNASLNNFTIRINTSGVNETYRVDGSSIIFNLTKNLNYTLFVNVTGYAPKTNVTTLDDTIASSYSMYFFKENSLYIRVFDEQTGLLINDRNISIEFISDDFATENTTSTGALIVYPLIQGDYRVRYSANEYPERLYFLSVTSGETQAIDVYSLKGSSGTNITCAVYDEKGDPVQGSYLKLLRYYLSCNCYKTVEIGETAFDGTTSLLVEFNSELYKILIDYNGENYLQTTPFKITSTILNFYITLEDLDPTGELRQFQDLVYDLSYDGLTDTFTFTYSDVNNQLARGCLEIFQTSLSSETSLNRTCVNSTGATINLVRPVLNGSSYKAKAEVYYGDVRILAEQLLVSKNTGLATIGNGATLLIIFLILTFSLISLWNANVSIVMVLIALIFASMLDLLTIGGTALMGIIGAGIIIVIQNKS